MSRLTTALAKAQGFEQRRSEIDEEYDMGSTVADWPALDPGAFHGLAGKYVRAIEPHTESDPAAVLVTFLVAYGNAAGRTAYTAVENDRHHANLFAVLAGMTAKGRKGTSFNQGIRLPGEASSDWKNERILYGGLSSGEGLINRVRDPGEGEAVTDRRLLVFEPEFASVLRVCEREGNTLSAILRSGWDSGRLNVLTRKDPLVASDVHLSILGHITRDELLRYLNRTEIASGLANRFLFCAVRRSKELPDGGQGGEVDWSPMVAEMSEAIAFAQTCGRVDKSPDARELWHKVYSALSDDSKPGIFGAATARAEAQVLRLSLVYALLDRSYEIGESHMLAALSLWNYCENSARWIFGESLGDPDAESILDGLRAAHPRKLTQSQISNELFQRHRTADRIRRSLTTLESAGQIECTTESTAGRSVSLWGLRKKRNMRNKAPLEVA